MPETANLASLPPCALLLHAASEGREPARASPVSRAPLAFQGPFSPHDAGLRQGRRFNRAAISAAGDEACIFSSCAPHPEEHAAHPSRRSLRSLLRMRQREADTACVSKERRVCAGTYSYTRPLSRVSPENACGINAQNRVIPKSKSCPTLEPSGHWRERSAQLHGCARDPFRRIPKPKEKCVTYA